MRPYLFTFHTMLGAGRTWMVSSGSPAQRLALEELDATIRGLHRRKWGEKEGEGRKGMGNQDPEWPDLYSSQKGG